MENPVIRIKIIRPGTEERAVGGAIWILENEWASHRVETVPQYDRLEGQYSCRH